MHNIINVSESISDLPKTIRYIMDESYGSSNNEFNTSWVEIQAIDQNGVNIALHKSVTANFVPVMDVTGQSGLETMVNGKVNLGQWVSCNIALVQHLPVKVIIDLGAEYELDKIVLYHGWWTKRNFKNCVYVGSHLHELQKIYDYRHSEPVYETFKMPLIIQLR